MKKHSCSTSFEKDEDICSSGLCRILVEQQSEVETVAHQNADR